jgi:hypothetical protein
MTSSIKQLAAIWAAPHFDSSRQGDQSMATIFVVRPQYCDLPFIAVVENGKAALSFIDYLERTNKQPYVGDCFTLITEARANHLLKQHSLKERALAKLTPEASWMPAEIGPDQAPRRKGASHSRARVDLTAPARHGVGRSTRPRRSVYGFFRGGAGLWASRGQNLFCCCLFKGRSDVREHIVLWQACTR